MSEETVEEVVDIRGGLVSELEAFGVSEDYIKPHWSTTRLQQEIAMHTKQKATRAALDAKKAKASGGE